MPIDVAIDQDVQSLVRQIDENSLTWLHGVESPDTRETLGQRQPYVIKLVCHAVIGPPGCSLLAYDHIGPSLYLIETMVWNDDPLKVDGRVDINLTLIHPVRSVTDTAEIKLTWSSFSSCVANQAVAGKWLSLQKSHSSAAFMSLAGSR